MANIIAQIAAAEQTLARAERISDHTEQFVDAIDWLAMTDQACREVSMRLDAVNDNVVEAHLYLHHLCDLASANSEF